MGLEISTAKVDHYSHLDFDFRFDIVSSTLVKIMSFINALVNRCVAAKGDDASECEKFAKFYRSLCPSEWVMLHIRKRSRWSMYQHR
ncbi:hypothetical protein L2E82_04306 [Cichorium intybus]|uniref:Uncharacterized protein n=1 Tax=Cichorium intybus TaxID=13427 RepID=A0ACB9H5C2_CICIN|nr:hypothetical protein L2E82_04306 [Cichorium intybus]